MISWDDFKKQPQEMKTDFGETNIVCPKCGVAIWKNVGTVFISYPPKHQYMCFKCGWTDVG